MPATKSKPEFSIITPVLHETETIGNHIARLKQLGPAEQCELIIVDGDPDCTTIRAIHDNTVRTIFSEPGRAKQMNAGAHHAKGDVLIFLHVDTTLPPHALNKITTSMKNDQYVGGAFDLGIDSDRVALKMISRIASLRSRLTRIPYGDQAIFVRRTYFESLGGYCEIPLMEDVELMRRIKKRGDKIFIISDPTLSSARRWEQEGLLYCTLRNWVLITLYYLGVSPERLVRYYRFRKKRT